MNPLSRLRINLLLLAFLCIGKVGPLQAQVKAIDNTLLWKITGNSLSKPSFLFGTIHLQDKRVFNFSDSLYSFLQRADGFAMEIHPDSVVAALIAKEDEKMKDKLLKKYLKKDDFDQLSRKLKKDLGINADKLTVRDAYMLRDHLSKPDARDDDMPTFVDAYLFGMARNQGKEIVGLEEAGDQLKMLEDIRGNFDVRAIVQGMKKEKGLVEKMVQLYINEDLKAIQDMMSYLPDQTEDKLLNFRNEVMVSRMDSLMPLKSFVVAVGTAHLPGHKGIIELLRRKGYTVEPVFTTTRTHANDYTIKAGQKTEWVDVKEPALGYRTRMPGKPSPMKLLDGGMKMNMYMDLTSMRLYYSAFIVPAITVQKSNVDSLLQALSKNTISTNGKAISSKRFRRDEFEGIDFVFKQATDNMHLRVQVLASDNRVYLVGFGAPRLAEMDGKEADDFFKAFVIEAMPENTWEVYTYKDHYFSISVPNEPAMASVPATDSTIRVIQFNSTGSSTGGFYAVNVSTANPGFIIFDDSSRFQYAMERLKATLDLHNISRYDTIFRGFHSNVITGSLKGDLWLKCVVVNRGNRMYTLMAICNLPDSASSVVNKFFDSFALIEYPKMQWQEKQFPEYAFSVPLAGSFTKISFLDEAEDSAAALRDYQWSAYDSATATSFFVTRRGISPYLWLKHDSVLLLKYMRELIDENETLKSYRYIKNGNSNGVEFDIDRPNSELVQRLRILLNGEGLYVLQTDAPKQYWDRYDYKRFLENFRFIKEEQPSFLYNNSIETFLAAINSTDSATRTNARLAMEHIMVDSSNLNRLLDASLVEYKVDDDDKLSVNQELFNVISKIRYSRFDQTIADYYNRLSPAQEEMKYSLLEVLASQQTSASFDMIDRLMKKGLPTKGDPHNFYYLLSDSIELSRKFYPWFITLSSDTLLGNLLFPLHAKMLEKEFVTLDAFKAHENIFLQAAKNELAAIAASKNDYYYSAGLTHQVRLLTALETEASYALVRKFMRSKFINIKYTAATELLKKGQKVDDATLLAIAADTLYRIDLYEELLNLKLLKLFPVKYLTQRAMAESCLANAVEETPSKVSFVGERTALYNGKKQKFYLFKYTFEYEDQKPVHYLCIAGAYNPDGKTITIVDNICGMYEEEEFRQSAIDRQFKAFLAQFEEED